jgi:hypothetical protein
MSSKKHRHSQGRTNPIIEPKDRQKVAQFSVLEVVQFSVA